MVSQTSGHWIKDVKVIFTEEIQAAQGTVTDSFEDESRLIARSVLPRERTVGRDDPLQAGVALRVSGPTIAVYPYIFRQVCTNGAIMAHVLGSQQVIQVDPLLTSEIDSPLRIAIRACCNEDIFNAAIDQIRAGKDVTDDPALNMIRHLSRLPPQLVSRFMDTVFNQWMRGPDRSRFGMMNAITAMARDTADPEARWDLEELGGRIGVPTLSKPPSPLSSKVETEQIEVPVHAG